MPTTPRGYPLLTADQQYALVTDYNKLAVKADAEATVTEARAQDVADAAKAFAQQAADEAERIARNALSKVEPVRDLVDSANAKSDHAVTTAEAAYAYNQALVAPAADIVNAVVTDPASEAGALVASKLSVNEAPLTPYQFGAVTPSSDKVDNTAALSALFEAARTATPSAAAIYLPPGAWMTMETLPMWRGMRLTGAGRVGSRLVHRGPTGSLFYIDAACSNVSMSDMTLERHTGDGHIFDFAPSGGGLWSATFERMIWRNHHAASGRLWNQTSGYCHRATWSDIEFFRNATNPLAPFYVRSKGDANGNRLQSILAHGSNNTLAPAIDIGSTAPNAYLTDWHMTNILGEQNPGGLIHAQAVAQLHISSATDEDVPLSIGYQADVFRFTENEAGVVPLSVSMHNSTRYGGGTHKDGVHDIYAPTVRSMLIDSCTPLPVSMPSKIVAHYALILADRTGDRNLRRSMTFPDPPTLPARPSNVYSPGPAGSMTFDTTLNKPLWSDGTNWRDASGAVV